MYPAKKARITELLMNALSLPAARTEGSTRHGEPIPTRREDAIQRSQDELRARRESYFATARLLWWNR